MQAGTAQGRTRTGPAAASEAERLGLDPGQDVLVVERVRTADGRPVVFSRDIMPGRIVGDRADAADQMLGRSIYEVLERDLGIVINHGVASFRPVRADRAIARLLGTRSGELLLYLWQVDYAEGGAAVLSSHEYHLADAAALPLPNESADLAILFMSPQDIDDLDGALREAARVLVPGGHLRMAIVHPMNSAGRFDSTGPDATFEIRASYFDERRYADTFERAGLTMTFASSHRSLERVAAAILGAGFLIDYVAEPPATNAPPGDRWRRMPLFLHLGAVKPT